MKVQMYIFDEKNEISNFQNIAKKLKPGPGEIPAIQGLDIYGETISLLGEVSGDHIIYVDFAKRFNLDERIKQAEQANKIDLSNRLKNLKTKSGILVADVAGHSITDALLNAMLHQAFLVGAGYELTANGEITIDLFEAINQRFNQSSSIDKFITMIYGEVRSDGEFRFISAGHQHPLIFSREYNKIVNIDNQNFISFTPIGTLPSESDMEGKITKSIFGYKKRYSLNKLKVMGHGDILLLFTDGFTEQLNGTLNYVADNLENQLIRSKDLSAKEIFYNIKNDFRNYCPTPDDDATMIIIKRV